MNVFAGTLTVPEVSGLMIGLYIQSMFFCWAGAIGSATSYLVGNLMGENKVALAKAYLRIGGYCSLTTAGIIEILVILFADNLARFYSGDEEIQEKIELVLRLFLLLYPPDFVSCVLGSSLRAIGKQRVGSLIIIVNLYCITIPFVWISCLGFDAGLYGVVFGFIISVWINLFSYLFVFSKTDWNEQARQIIEKLKADQNATK